MAYQKLFKVFKTVGVTLAVLVASAVVLQSLRSLARDPHELRRMELTRLLHSTEKLGAEEVESLIADVSGPATQAETTRLALSVMREHYRDDRAHLLPPIVSTVYAHEDPALRSHAMDVLLTIPDVLPTILQGAANFQLRNTRHDTQAERELVLRSVGVIERFPCKEGLLLLRGLTETGHAKVAERAREVLSRTTSAAPKADVTRG